MPHSVEIVALALAFVVSHW